MMTAVKRVLTGALTAIYLLVPGTSWSMNLSISDIPLFLGGGVEPNIMFTMDDSGSMYWSFMPDDIYSDHDDVRGLAANRNHIAYDPRVSYQPPLNADGTQMANASFTGAWNDGYANYSGSTTCVVNLSSNYRPTWYYGNHCNTNYSDYSNEYWTTSAEAAYYYVHYLNHPDGPQAVPSNCSAGSETDNDCYIKIVVSSNSGVGNSDERQNFANWYSYYRKRTYLAKAGVGRAFAQQGSGIRVGYGAINEGSRTIDGESTTTIRRGVRAFKDVSPDSDRTDFFDLLYDEDASGGTPLRHAADDVGQYFERDDNQGPWNTTPGVASGADLSCRGSYHILMSDGYWNSTRADTSGARANNDGTDGPTITSSTGDSFTYDAVTPFTDSRSNTLADVAMYYWKRDLRGGSPGDASYLENDVPTNPKDPAFWQHLVTFTVGLGVEGTITPSYAFGAIDTTIAVSWPNPTATNPAKIDDMLHAAVNSRGGFFSAKNPTEFSNALAETLSDIADRTSSAASVVLNSNTLFQGSRLYQAIFQTDKWSGEIRSYTIDTGTGNVSLDTNWSAAGGIPVHGSRRILTHDGAAYDGSNGITFRWGSLSTAQKTALDAANAANSSSPILDYLRGDRSNEIANGGPYRTRESLLGDIINSTPAFVNPPNAPYYDNWGASEPESATTAKYSDFRNTHASRTPFIAVGANDGMLHMFNAQTGDELYSYVPSMLMSKMPDLLANNYNHEYFADGAPTVVDAFYGSAWHTTLVAGLNAGGQGVYALDVTYVPSSVTSESSLVDKVLWEFTDADDADLGYTFSRPNIVRLNNGVWAAIFGNGYNNTEADGAASTTGNAVLYIVNIQTGAIIAKLDTKEGASEDPLGNSRPNGLSTVTPIDVDGDYIVDYVFAGDLFGNVWKFDLSSTNTNQWGIPYGNTSNPKPLFRAWQNPSSSATAQPITTRVQVVRHPEIRGGLLILFGTGKYIEVGDNDDSGQTTQSYYAVWDRDENNLSEFNRNHLLQQQILYEKTVNGADYRITSNNVMTWFEDSGLPASGEGYLGWYIDLYNTEAGNTDNHGERTVSDSVVRGDRVIFTTLLPSTNPCDYGGSGWLMELQYADGSRPLESPFDVNPDGVFDVDDLVDPDGAGGSDAVTVSGRKSTIGIVPTPAILSRPGSGGGGGGQLEHKYESGSTGQVEKVDENPGAGEFGRQSWRQLFK